MDSSNLPLPSISTSPPPTNHDTLQATQQQQQIPFAGSPEFALSDPAQQQPLFMSPSRQHPSGTLSTPEAHWSEYQIGAFKQRQSILEQADEVGFMVAAVSASAHISCTESLCEDRGLIWRRGQRQGSKPLRANDALCTPQGA